MAKYIDIFIIIDWTIVVGIFLLALITIIKENYSIPRKIFGSIIILGGAIVSIRTTGCYLPLLKEAAATAQSDFYNFIDVLFFAGTFWIMSCGPCVAATIRCVVDDFDTTLKLVIKNAVNVLLVMIGLAIGNYFCDTAL